MRQATGHDWFDEELHNCADVIVQEVVGGERRICLAYTTGLVDEMLLTESILPRLQIMLRDGGEIGSAYALIELRHDSELARKRVFAQLFSGHLLFFMDGDIRSFSIAKMPGRQPEESSSELSVKGPKDGFVEELHINLGLIRKRIRTTKLKVELFTLGTEMMIDMALLYMDGVTKPEWVDEARKRLDKIHTKAINGAAQVEEMLGDRSVSLFPLIDYAGRPDSAADALMNGSVVFLLENSPLIFIAPVNLFSLLKSPEDNYLPYHFVTVEKLVRVIALVATIFLPGFWVSVSAFNVDQIPFPLLSTIILSRVGLPVSATMEMFLMLSLFEVFREAGVRLPRAVGQTVAVVGGVVVGEAAIEAGFTSPTMLVIVSLTIVSSFTLVNQSLYGAVTIMRVLVLLFCMLFGMYGFFLSMMAVLTYLASIRSFGLPYLQPFGPFHLRQALSTLIRLPSNLSNGPYQPRRSKSKRGGK
ncbi:spore germination protein [Cohnella fermenti]|uniref:Spore germination protein n=1 Tax=Cohnella fermenti TaxID=2565925 RepID=A0A4S4BWM8_9BACL|nr:spore germination protein [Cohnella fermenti]THF79491.1 spore germination protein [Cohnella fermenti]